MKHNAKDKGRGSRSLGLWITLGTLVALIAVLLLIKKPEDDPTPTTPHALPVRVLYMTPRDVADHLVLAARLWPCISAELAAEKGGRIVEIVAHKGERVEKQQILMRQDARQWELLKAQAQVEADDAERNLNRWRELKKTGAVADNAFDRIKHRHEMALAALAQATLNVERCLLRSPHSGILDARYVDEGEYVKEGDAVFRVVQVDTLKLAMDIPEKDVRAVKQGNDITFTVSAHPDVVFTGRVSFVAASTAPGRPAFLAEATVDNTDQRLNGGMIARVTLQRGQRQGALVLPLAAIIPQRGEDVVYLARATTNDELRAERRVVKIDALMADEAVIKTGIAPGDRVVIEGQRRLTDAMLIEMTTNLTERAGAPE